VIGQTDKAAAGLNAKPPKGSAQVIIQTLGHDRSRLEGGVFAMLQVVFDDTLAVPEAEHAVVGVERFGNLVVNRRSRVEAMRELTREAGWPPPIHLQTPADITELIERLRQESDDAPYLICPSHLVPACGEEHLATFLKQVEYAPSALHMPLNGGRDKRGWSLMRGSLLERFLVKQREGDLAGFFEQHGEMLVDVPGRLRLLDLSDERALQDFLSGQFDARHFNAIERDEYTVVKSSRDRVKLKREFDFYGIVSPELRMFLVQPFDFRDDGQTARYRMERVSVPDMALQWVHNAFEPQEFERFLNHIFHFIAIRPALRVGKAKAARVFDTLYVEKVEERIAALKGLPAYRKLVPLLENGCGGIDALVRRYMDLLERNRKRFVLDRLVIGHGDPCFSNILYSKTNQFLKLIDPRGADSESDLYTDPYYDVAKLSHSVQGTYDFINHDMFNICVDTDLSLRLSIKDESREWAGKLFRAQLDKAGFEADLTRLCEASLFISMLPLHIDRPRKVLAFALRAASILDKLADRKRTAQ
jgi:hypothetical protein